MPLTGSLSASRPVRKKESASTNWMLLILTVNKSITLAKYIDHWLAEVAPKKLKKTTYSRDQQDVRRILPALGHYKLTDLRKEVTAGKKGGNGTFPATN